LTIFSTIVDTDSCLWAVARYIEQDPAMEQKIRVSTSTGRPLGSEDFIGELENKLCRKILPGKAGRPKKPKLI
jgi:hypothetical protein